MPADEAKRDKETAAVAKERMKADDRLDRQALTQRKDELAKLRLELAALEGASVATEMTRLYGKPGMPTRDAADRRVDTGRLIKDREDRLVVLRRMVPFVEGEIAQLDGAIGKRVNALAGA